jgi:hypothetical protein
MIMFRTSDMVLIAVIVSAAALTYKTKHDAEDWLGQVRKLEREISFEEDSIDVLKADWSLLTQPSRLQKLADIYNADLSLEPVGARQITGFDVLPERPLTIEDLTRQSIGEVAQGPKDPITTGGVDQ